MFIESFSVCGLGLSVVFFKFCNMKIVLVLCVVSSLLVVNVQCARILCIFMMPSTSHYILGNTYARAMAEAGHDVTMISPFEDLQSTLNGSYRNIVLTDIMKEKRKLYDKENYFTKMYRNSFLLIYMSHRIGLSLTRKTFQHPSVKQLIQSNETYDVVVIEQFFNDALKGLATHFKAHQILINPIGSYAWVNFLVGNPSVPTYSPDMFTGYSHKMGFLQRCYNIFVEQIVLLYKYFFIYGQHEEIMKEHIPNAPLLKDVLYNVSLVLSNTDPSVGFAAPKVPNMIDIGGFHIQEQKLPKDLQEFMDGAEDGVILFSMGSTIKGVTFPKDKQQELVNTFKKLPQRIIWKWENDTFPDQPDNVMIVKWLPQQAVLAHPNLKLYICQGGALSLIEATYHGVPVIVIPIFVDQPMNANVAQENGYGVTLDLNDLSEKRLTCLINEILTNKIYKETAIKRSQSFKDKPITPLKSAIYWTEYVIQHKGAQHLRVQGVQFDWVQYYLVDIYTTLILIVISIIYTIRRLR